MEDLKTPILDFFTIEIVPQVNPKPRSSIGVTQNGPNIKRNIMLTKLLKLESKPRSSIGVIQNNFPEGSKAILLHQAQGGAAETAAETAAAGSPGVARFCLFTSIRTL